MTVSYKLSKEHLTRGMKHHLKYRGKIMRRVRLGLIVLFIFLISASLSSSEPVGPAYLTCFILCSLVLLLRNPVLIWRSIRQIQKGKPENMLVTFTVTEEGVSLQSELGESKTLWSAFMDKKVEDDGILIYPQKNIYFWIPRGEVSGGTWEDFTTLIESKITVT